VEPKPFAAATKEPGHGVALVDAVVVQDHVDPTHPAVGLQQCPQAPFSSTPRPRAAHHRLGCWPATTRRGQWSSGSWDRQPSIVWSRRSPGVKTEDPTDETVVESSEWVRGTGLQQDAGGIMEHAGTPEKPLVVAAVICDQAIREENTHKWSLIGIFSDVSVPALPAIHPGCCLFLAITNIYAATGFTVLIGRDGKPPMAQVEAQVEAATPLAVAEMSLRLANMPLLDEGMYRIDVVCAGDRIGGTKFRVRRVEA